MTQPQPPRLYHDLAHLWPVISPPEQYASEADAVRRILEAHGLPPGRGAAVIEFGAGGGHTLYHLKHDYDAVASDLSEQMLTHCRDLNPEVQTVVGDMRTLRLDRRFDAVLIHDAIDYMTSESDVQAALETAWVHLKPGGVAVIAPTYVREKFVEHETASDHVETEDLALTYFSYVHDPDELDDTFELVLVYLLRAAVGGELRIETDRHTCGLFAADQWLAWLQDAGFEAEHREDENASWTLFVARRPKE
ncbi:MAG: class I SAM-dependent methyltransferase, partial [Phycisphaeraceae bacterium]